MRMPPEINENEFIVRLHHFIVRSPASENSCSAGRMFSDIPIPYLLSTNILRGNKTARLILNLSHDKLNPFILTRAI